VAHDLAVVGVWRQSLLRQRDHRLRLLDTDDLGLWNSREERQLDQPGAAA
jgi:hypothetical protein